MMTIEELNGVKAKMADLVQVRKVVREQGELLASKTG